METTLELVHALTNSTPNKIRRERGHKTGKIEHPNNMLPAWPERAKRHPKNRQRIARWHGRGMVCFRCAEPTKWAKLDRAHMIERSLGGLDHYGNTGLLCKPCHKKQPIFGPGQENEARVWFGLARLTV